MTIDPSTLTDAELVRFAQSVGVYAGGGIRAWFDELLKRLEARLTLRA